jgi:hypothetical protein
MRAKADDPSIASAAASSGVAMASLIAAFSDATVAAGVAAGRQKAGQPIEHEVRESQFAAGRYLVQTGQPLGRGKHDIGYVPNEQFDAPDKQELNTGAPDTHGVGAWIRHDKNWR